MNTWQSKTIGGAALLIAFTGIISRLLGFFRDRLLASTFGAGDLLDAYYAAFRIPDLFYGLLVAGALSAAFVPLFTEYLAENKQDKAWELTTHLLQAVLLFLAGLSLLGIIFAPWLVEIMVPGFNADQQVLTVYLTRIMLLSPFFLGVSAVFSGVLMSFKRFMAYSFAPVFYNLGIIGGILYLVPRFGIVGVAWGVVAGAFLHMAVQYPAMASSGFRYRSMKESFFQDPALRHVFLLMIPRSLSMGITQLSLFVVTIFASTLSAGSLASFNFANNIQSVPLGIFGVAFSLAVFPVLSLYAAQKNDQDFFYSLINTSKRILFFVIPISVVMIIFRAQVVRIILGAGAFDWEDTIMTFGILKYFAISLFAQCLIPLFARAFFAVKNTKTPLYIALASELIHIILLPLLIPYFQVQALAISFSCATIINIVLLYVYLRKQLTYWNDRDFLWPVFKMTAAAFLAGVIAQISKSVFALTTGELDTFLEVFLQLLAGVIIGGGTYIALCGAFAVEELDMFRKLFIHKLLGHPEAIAQAEDHPERGEW